MATKNVVKMETSQQVPSNSGIRVLLVTDTYYPKFDGPVLVTTHYAKNFLTMTDVRAEIVAPHYPDPDNKKIKYKDNQPFPVHRCRSWKSQEGYRMGIPAFDGRFKRWLKKTNYDLLHFHSPFSMCEYLGKFAKKRKIPTLFTFHTKFHEDFERLMGKGFRYNVMMNYIMTNINRLDYAVAVSNGSAEVLKSYGYDKPVGVIRNGADLSYPDNADTLVKTVNEKYDISPDIPVFISVGRIVSNKNLALAFEALKIVANRGYDFRFLVIGDGPEEEALRTLSKNLWLEDKVIWAGKIMDRDLLSAHYLRSDLLMLPSMFDTSSLVLLEAAALKLPTIMNNGCIPAEVVTDGVNGILAEQTPESWAEKTIWAITHKKEMSAMRDAAQIEVYKSWATVTEEVRDYYFKIIKDFNENEISNKLKRK